MLSVIYYSNVTEAVHRFAQQLHTTAPDIDITRLPVRPGGGTIAATAPYVLIVPTYGSGNDNRTIPKPVLELLEAPGNVAHLRGVIGSGNTNFGADYNRAARKIAAKFTVPVLHLFEISGLPEDVADSAAAIRSALKPPTYIA